MSPRKLSDADKSDILKLYRQPEETTSTLAVRYGVSNSTISRILKSNLEETEYEGLIQQKRSNRTPSDESPPDIEAPQPPTEPSVESDAEPPPVVLTTPPLEEAETEQSVSMSPDGRRRRKRSSVATQPETEPDVLPTQLQLDLTTSVQTSDFDESEESIDEIEPSQAKEFEGLLDEDLMDLDDEDDDLDDDLEDDLEDDLDDEDWEDETGDVPTQGRIKASVKGNFNVQVLPLSEASLPRTCYLVVDRAAELIARPLKEFSDLGRIPAEEVQEKTLPVFDNHKVARRFSNRSQRVIKVPDGRMLHKACSHLQAKGITRLLIDGQVYSLLPTQP
jgi:transposase-like protein